MIKNNLVIMLDFDGVLFDWAHFVRDMEDIFAEFGVSREMFWRAFNIKNVRKQYTLKKHIHAINVLCPKLGLENNSFKKKQLVLKFRDSLLHKSSNYLLDGSIELLEWLGEHGWHRILLSHGWGFQTAKIHWSGIHYRTKQFLCFGKTVREDIFYDLFEKRIITPDKTKISAAKMIKDSHRRDGYKNIFVLVDDRASIIDGISQSISDIISIQLMFSHVPGRSPDLAKKSHGLIYNFEELKEYLLIIEKTV